MAGTTYAIGAQRSKKEKEIEYCKGRAIKAFEKCNIIGLLKKLEHHTNLATVYADYPPEDNPMKGILMLLDLNKKHPDYVPVLNNLARLGLKTGQFDKAISRLEKALEIDPENAKAHCLMAQVYEAKGDSDKAREFTEKCRAFSLKNQ